MSLVILCVFVLALVYGGDVVAIVRDRQRLKHGLAPKAMEPDDEEYDRADFAGDCAYAAIEKGYEVRIRHLGGNGVWVHVIDDETSVLTITAHDADDGWGAALRQIEALPARSGGSA